MEASRTHSTSSAAIARVVDLDYAAIADATQQAIAWPRVLSNAQWKWIENVHGFSLYAIEDDSSKGFSLLATGVVRGSVAEIASLLIAASQDEFSRSMIALFDKDFKHGTYVADVGDHLSIRTASFGSSGWLHRDDEWCFLESTARGDQTFEKLMTSLRLNEVISANDLRKAKLGRGKPLEHVICGYKVVPDDSPHEDLKNPQSASARVHFFAEYAPPASKTRTSRFRSSKPDAMVRVTQQRLLSVAGSCERLSLLVRRRRLGVQVLMDSRRVMSLANHKCISCAKNQRLVKLCRVCGNAVCRDCSDKYERETCVPHTTAIRIEKVRVCDLCITRIESGDFSNVTHRSVFGPTVYPDHDDEYGSARATRRDLKTLLRDALLSDPSPQRKSALISVIRSVLEQEEGPSSRPRIKSTLSTATSTSTEADHLAALDSFTLASTSHADADLAGKHGRSYPLDPRDLASFPMPASEAARLDAIQNLGVLEKPEWTELDIICDLAAKEVGAFASIVSIITKDQQRVVAANNPHFRTMHTNRENSFCTHTIMDNRPLIVPHPEADFRLSHIARKWNLGVGFYCGFPLKAEDDTVIGTLCCVDQQTHELTESQFSAMERLARTATKIIRVEATKRRPSGAAA